MKFLISILFCILSFRLLANTLQITCDKNDGLQTIHSPNQNFQFSAESKAAIEARLLAENARLEARSDTAMKCLNQLKLSHQDQKTISEINDVLNSPLFKKGKMIRDQGKLDREMKRLDLQIQSCEDPKLVEAQPKIALQSSSTGLNKNKNGSYESDSFERVIETSLREGVDPFLALSILLLENPPTIGDAKANSYRQNFGTLPVDSIAAYDVMGCYAQKVQDPQIKNPKELSRLATLGHNALLAELKKFEKPETAAAEVECEQYKKTKSRCSAFLTGQKVIPQIDILTIRGHSEKSNQYRICSSDFSAAVGKFANFESAENSTGGKNCCADLKSNLSQFETQEEFLGILGIRYVKKKVQECILKSPLTYCVQKYNGLGCFNCSRSQEQLKSDCLRGMVMSDRPVYGARAMDLMLNSLMTNAQVNLLVQKISRRTKTNVVSVLCMNKSGLQKVDMDQFEKEQKEYLLNGKNHAYKFSQSTINGSQFVENKDDPRYQKAESERQKACSKYY